MTTIYNVHVYSNNSNKFIFIFFIIYLIASSPTCKEYKRIHIIKEIKNDDGRSDRA